MKVTVKDLIGIARVLAGGAHLGRTISTPQLGSPDLSSLSTLRNAAAGVLHVSPSQLARMRSLSARERSGIIRSLLKTKPACLILSGSAVCLELSKAAEAAKIPVLKTGNLRGLTRLLTDRLAPELSIHGVLVDIFGLGTLILGESAVGKSEAALDLVLRGHKLAADDVVLLERTGAVIQGRPTELGRDLLQIRGLGVVDIRALYGESATAGSSTVGLVVELEEWRQGRQYSLVGLRERRHRLLGINIPYLKLPVKPGRNMATLIEVAARNQMLKNRGIYTARVLNRKLRKRLTA
jgi:HPr kinase/phosphorylase